MKKLFFIITLFLIPLSVYAQSGTKDGTFEVKDLDRLFLRIDAGMEIQISGTSESDKIHYEYSFDGNAEAYKHYFENFNPTFENKGGEARFLLDFPKQDGKKVNFKIEEHLLVFTVPKSIFLELTTRYSSVEIDEIQKGLNVQNRSGLVKVINVNQSVFIANEYGAIDATNISGDLNIVNRSARIDVKEVTGQVTINGEYSKMNISKINGDISISNRSGVVNAFYIMGSITAKGSYVEYELTNIDGDIKIDNKSGKISINTARSLTVKGDYTHVNASNIRSRDGVNIEGRSASIILDNISGSAIVSGQYLKLNFSTIVGVISIENRSAEVNIQNAQNDLNIYGEYLPIRIRDFKGENINIVNRSNDITIDVIADLKNVFIEAEYGKVTLGLKKKYSGDVEVETSYGKFITSLLIDDQQVSKSNNSQIISGKVGKGNSRISIKTKNADVRIDQQ